jgi:hypothetical protein
MSLIYLDGSCRTMHATCIVATTVVSTKFRCGLHGLLLDCVQPSLCNLALHNAGLQEGIVRPPITWVPAWMWCRCLLQLHPVVLCMGSWGGSWRVTAASVDSVRQLHGCATHLGTDQSPAAHFHAADPVGLLFAWSYHLSCSVLLL